MTTVYEDFTKKAGFAFLCKDFGQAPQAVRVTDTESAGALIRVAPGCCLSTFNAVCPGWGTNVGHMDLSIYRRNGDYAAAVSAQPVFRETVTDYVDNARVTFHIPLGLVGEGEWLCLFENGSADAVGLYTCAAPEETEGCVTLLSAYRNGQPAACGFKAYVTYTTDKPVVKPDLPLTTLTPGKAHVIFLSGQSNATGQAVQDIYRQHADPAVYDAYVKGFDNILIDYAVNGGSNESHGFVPVSFGMGCDPSRFGPEIGIADYLNRAFPGETFYIIKDSWSGAGLTKHFAEGQQVYEYCMKRAQEALARLAESGLDPEVFILCWMQGETDSWYMEDTLTYDAKQADVIARMTDRLMPYVAPGGLAFADCGISDTWAWTLNSIINVQKRICCETNPNWTFIDTIDLGCMKENDDIAHYDSDDMMEIGERMGQVVEQVIRRSGGTL